MAPLIVKVAVSMLPYAVDKPYDYAVPEQWEELAVPGVRVLVPFGRGNQKREGIVLQRARRPAGEQPLKPISQVLDAEPMLDRDMLQLLLWLRARCYATFYEVARASLPAGLWFQTRRIYRLCTPPPGPAPDDPVQAALLQQLEEAGGERSAAQWMAEGLTRTQLRALEELVEGGWIAYEETVKRRAGDRTEKVYSLALPEEEIRARMEKSRSAARRDVLECLLSEEEMSAADLRYMSGVSASTLSTMEKQGLLQSRKREIFRQPACPPQQRAEPIVLTRQQQAAVDGCLSALRQPDPGAALLVGVTGKTKVYVKVIEQVLAQGKSALLLVPEIGLTPQLWRTFLAYFGQEVAVLHSGLSVGERMDQWKKIRQGKSRVVIGTRSAVFAPLQNLGVIIMDEEQDGAYRSENAPRYHARDVAKYRCRQQGALFLMGSATPSLESAYGAQCKKYPAFWLTQRYGGTPLPEVILSDLRQVAQEGFFGVIGPVLERELEDNLRRGEQSILFLNRRGNSRRITCVLCGYTPQCVNCSTAMTYHSANHRVMCHYCGYSEKVPTLCPQCGSRHLLSELPGTQKAEQELIERLPGCRVLRMDTDTTAGRYAHEEILRQFAQGGADILLGTQMVAKGLDFDRVSLVGVLDADQALFDDSYLGKERAFSLLTQVIGRAGRREKPGRAVIQTRHPGHPVLLAAARQDYAAFYRREIQLRRALHHPPFYDLIRLTVSGPAEAPVLEGALRLRDRMSALLAGQFADLEAALFGPVPAVVLRVNRRYRYHLTLRTHHNALCRQLLHGLLREFAGDKKNRIIALSVDVNPS